MLVVLDVHFQGQADLVQVAQARGALGGPFAASQDWQEQAGEQTDNGNHHQQLDQRKTGRRPAQT